MAGEERRRRSNLLLRVAECGREDAVAQQARDCSLALGNSRRAGPDNDAKPLAPGTLDSRSHASADLIECQHEQAVIAAIDPGIPVREWREIACHAADQGWGVRKQAFLQNHA